jgi:hypothetical protein
MLRWNYEPVRHDRWPQAAPAQRRPLEGLRPDIAPPFEALVSRVIEGASWQRRHVDRLVKVKVSYFFPLWFALFVRRVA